MENSSRKIKQLSTQLAKLKQDCKVLQQQISFSQKEHNLKTNQVRKIEQEIKKLSSNDSIIVSEHAILRYLERVKGIDLEEIKATILNDKIIELTKVLGANGTYPNENFSVVIKDNVVVTILT